MSIVWIIIYYVCPEMWNREDKELKMWNWPRIQSCKPSCLPCESSCLPCECLYIRIFIKMKGLHQYISIYQILRYLEESLFENLSIFLPFKPPTFKLINLWNKLVKFFIFHLFILAIKSVLFEILVYLIKFCLYWLKNNNI